MVRPSNHYDPADESIERDHRKTLLRLFDYVWPKGSGGFRGRVLASFLPALNKITDGL